MSRAGSAAVLRCGRVTRTPSLSGPILRASSASAFTLVKHPARLTLTTGVDAEGRLTARRADITLDGGAYSDASTLVALKTAFRIGGAYRWRAIDSKARVVRTTTVPSGSFRGFGGTQSSFASERQVDMIARRLGDD